MGIGEDRVDVIRLGAGSPVVLLPGLAGGWRLVAPLAERLARRHEVILCGLRGDNLPSRYRGDWEVSEYARDVVEVMDRLGLDHPSVMGVSFGGAVALELAVAFPDRIDSLIVHGAEAKFRTSIGSLIARRALERFPLPTDSPFINQFFNLLHGGKPASASLADYVIERCWETDQSVMAKRLAMLDSFDVSDRLWRVEAPTLVLAGSRDVIIPPRRQATLALGISGARFQVIEGAGHIGFLTHRAEIAGMVARFVRGEKPTPC
jgi:pimeloyl-ACP methyl ester carboxylesterase